MEVNDGLGTRVYCGSLFVWGKGFTIEIRPRHFAGRDSCARANTGCGKGLRRVEAVEGNSHFRAKDVEKTDRHLGLGVRPTSSRQTFSRVFSSE